ncbi:MAG: Rne/Rng family ribonuclease [Betaproteobacteria bacterium]|nr:Rne/Rng family ribonuclease [Betaproteobacteria bacterium]
MKRMLFNATQAEELRVAIVEGQKLIDLDIESAAKEQRKGNIYKGIVTRVEPSLEACFVDYGAERHGFLPFKEIARSALSGAEGGDFGRGRVQDFLKEGQELVVQVEKDERGTKGAALTNFVSLAGRYLVLMPNNPRGGGVSRRIEGEDRNELRDAMAQLEVPGGMSLIARTAGIGRTVEELQWDLNYLMQLWQAIDSAAKSQRGTFLIYQESSLVIRAIRDYFTPDIGEILIDTPAIYEQAHQFMAHVMPNNVNRVKLYTDSVPVFSRFQIEHQIENAYSRMVPLPSGGAIVIDHTEALVAIDVNSAQATRGADIEQTAFNTNLEAAEEVGRQMRLRDLGGLIVIDFIDMENSKNQREVEERLRDSLRHDRARIQLGKISRFGLLELSRQRLQPSLGETSYVNCPHCDGTGHVRGTESFALHLLRMLQEEAMKENTGAVHLQTPVEVATFLLNEKRTDILNIEARHKVEIILIPNIHFMTPRYVLQRLRHDQLNLTETVLPSYQMMEKPVEEVTPAALGEAKAERVQPMVQGITPSQPAPMPSAKTEEPSKSGKLGLFGRIFGWLGGLKTEPEAKPQPKKAEGRRERGEGRRGRQAEGREGRGRRERGERTERAERPDRGERTERQARSERQERGERPERGERTERPERRERPERAERAPREAQAVPQQQAIEAPAAEAGQEREGRGRRRRGRGRRGEGRPEAETLGEQQAPGMAAGYETAASAEPIVVMLEPAPAPVQAAPAKPEPAPVSMPAPNLDQAGLELVETRGNAAPASETATTGEGGNQRRRRPRPSVEAAPAEPLMMVETKNTGAASPAAEAPAQSEQPRRRARPEHNQDAAAAEPLVMVETKASGQSDQPNS